MKFKFILTILAAVFLFATIQPIDSEARGGGKTGGQGSSGLSKQSQSMEQNRVREQLHNQAGDKQSQSGTVQKKGNSYGPGDGTGNKGVRPQDGTGYGAPANR